MVATSGETHHPIVVRSGVPPTSLTGHVLLVTSAELAAADEYEVDDYTRVRARLASGTDAWVYVQRRLTRNCGA